MPTILRVYLNFSLSDLVCYRRRLRMEGERMLTVEEAAHRLGAHEQTVRRWLRDHRLTGYMPGGTKLGYRIPAREVERLLRLPNNAVERHFAAWCSQTGS